jgi:hypothetical protein
MEASSSDAALSARILEEAKCRACLDVTPFPWRGCPEGHIVCPACTDQLVQAYATANNHDARDRYTCPTCQVVVKRPKTQIHCRHLELLAEQAAVRTACLHAGCAERPLCEHLATHMSVCTRAPWPCPILACAWTGPSATLLAHVHTHDAAMSVDPIYHQLPLHTPLADFVTDGTDNGYHTWYVALPKQHQGLLLWGWRFNARVPHATRAWFTMFWLVFHADQTLCTGTVARSLRLFLEGKNGASAVSTHWQCNAATLARQVTRWRAADLLSLAANRPIQLAMALHPDPQVLYILHGNLAPSGKEATPKRPAPEGDAVAVAPPAKVARTEKVVVVAEQEEVVHADPDAWLITLLYSHMPAWVTLATLQRACMDHDAGWEHPLIDAALARLVQQKRIEMHDAGIGNGLFYRLPM